MIDVGFETLRRMKALGNYNGWIEGMIRPWLGNRVLEVGSGIGNFSQSFIGCDQLILSDIHPGYLIILRERYGANPRIGVEYCNLDESVSHLAGRGIDTIVALNVLEHIRDDAHALVEMASILSPGGRVILHVPAHPFLYGSLDIHLNHFRRYTKQDVREILAEARFEVEFMARFNMFGAIGWFLCSRILRNSLLPKKQLGLFNRLTPLFMAVEKWIPVPFGLSLIVIGRKI